VENKKMENFNQSFEKYKEKLALYVPVVARVHGKSHPEFLEVQKAYQQIIEKINQNPNTKPEITNELTKLKEITQNYQLPQDTCESYEAVYTMLAQIDKAYFL